MMKPASLNLPESTRHLSYEERLDEIRQSALYQPANETSMQRMHEQAVDVVRDVYARGGCALDVHGVAIECFDDVEVIVSYSAGKACITTDRTQTSRRALLEKRMNLF